MSSDIDYCIVNEKEDRVVAIVDGSMHQIIPNCLADFLTVITEERHATRRGDKEQEDFQRRVAHPSEVDFDDVVSWAEQVCVRVAEAASPALSNVEVRLACAIQNIVALSRD